MDVYAERIGASQCQPDRFLRSPGGCAGNVAIGGARLCLRTGILSAVGTDVLGDYLKSRLAAEGVETAGLLSVAGKRTAIAMADADGFGLPDLSFFRENAADAILEAATIDHTLIADAKMLVISGAHAAAGIGLAAAEAAMATACAAGCQVVLDIDHRPAFGASGGEGAMAARLQALAATADIVVGTEAEFCLAAGGCTPIEALHRLRARTEALLIMKLGPAGALLIPGIVPPRLDRAQLVPGYRIAARNPLGAGDAFLAGFLARHLAGAPLEECARYGNACGAIVASRLLCAAACPTTSEVDTFLAMHAPALQESG